MQQIVNLIKNLLPAVIIIIFLLAVYSAGGGFKDHSIVRAQIGDQELKLWLADTPATRQTGLSGRTDLPAGTGLLFVFPKADYHHFWMKEMNFPIDIIWLDDNRRIIGLTVDINPDTYPNTFGPPAPSRYVLEVPAGWSRANNLKPGDQLIIK